MKRLLLVLIVFFAVPIVLGGPLCADSNSFCGGGPLTHTGFGAVEICDTCFVCGVSDGVCPDDFHSGANYSNNDGDLDSVEYELVRMHIMKGLGDGESTRPNSGPSVSDAYRLSYSTGNLACEDIGASCGSIEESSDGENWFGSSASCSTNFEGSSNPNHFRARCSDVPIRSSCAECIDPDCGAEIRGIVYDADQRQPIAGATIVVQSPLSQVPTNMNAQSSSTGTYNMNTLRGKLTVECSAEGYIPMQKDVFLKRGTNVIDCPMILAQCSEQCTIPNAAGEEICRAGCAGFNDCSYPSNQITTGGIEVNVAQLCDGANLGSFIVVDRINSTHVEGVSCCSGTLQPLYRPEFKLESESPIGNLITRDYTKILDGSQVTLRIIVFEE